MMADDGQAGDDYGQAVAVVVGTDVFKIYCTLCENKCNLHHLREQPRMEYFQNISFFKIFRQK